MNRRELIVGTVATAVVPFAPLPAMAARSKGVYEVLVWSGTGTVGSQTRFRISLPDSTRAELRTAFFNWCRAQEAAWEEMGIALRPDLYLHMIPPVENASREVWLFGGGESLVLSPF